MRLRLVSKHFSHQQDPDARPHVLRGAGSPAGRSLRRLIVGILCLLAGLAPSFGGAAGTRSGTFSVNICLKSGGECVAPSPATPAAPATAPGVCTSDTLSERTGAVVRVVCATGQFVSIAPLPGGRVIGTQGGAYTYFFGSSFGSLQRADGGEFATGGGSIASFRIFNVTEIEGPVEMLVSF